MYVLAYDLGTGGIKAALFREDLSSAAEVFVEYPTYYPKPEIHEQYPEDWWNSVCLCTHKILRDAGVSATEVAGVALSGASLVAVPFDQDGHQLLDRVPIWSDMRAEVQAKTFFCSIPEEEWYITTGNGFPPACYPIFKLMWLQENQPAVFARIARAVGSKDYINYRLTGEFSTDFSYASGTGAYDLSKGCMRLDFLRAAGLPEDIFLEPVQSHTCVGRLTEKAAEQTGLSRGTPVFAGGVDNACMALGAVGVEEGMAYASLGSSTWIPLNSRQPVLDFCTRPYVFAHIEAGMFTSAYSLFAGGSSLRWARDTLFSDFPKEQAYQMIDQMVLNSPVGANGVLFHPGLAGGTMQDPSPHLRGAFMNLQLGTRREDLIRAVLEGVAMDLSLSLELLRKKSKICEPILFCGGGSRSQVWMEVFADVLNTEIVKTNIDQSAASLGAAAIAARGLRWQENYSFIPSLHKVRKVYRPNAANVERYRCIMPYFRQMCQSVALLGNLM